MKLAKLPAPPSNGRPKSTLCQRNPKWEAPVWASSLLFQRKSTAFPRQIEKKNPNFYSSTSGPAKDRILPRPSQSVSLPVQLRGADFSEGLNYAGKHSRIYLNTFVLVVRFVFLRRRKMNNLRCRRRSDVEVFFSLQPSNPFTTCATRQEGGLFEFSFQFWWTTSKQPPLMAPRFRHKILLEMW